MSCADAGEASHFDGGWEFKNCARIFTVNEASGSSTTEAYDDGFSGDEGPG